jgi:malate dehydrogenase
VRLGRSGVEEFLPLGPMNALEKDNLAALKAELLASIHKGVEFAHRAAPKQ